MALFIIGKTECSLCDELILVGDDIVGTTHFIVDVTDPLWRYSDSVTIIVGRPATQGSAPRRLCRRRAVLHPGLC